MQSAKQHSAITYKLFFGVSPTDFNYLKNNNDNLNVQVQKKWRKLFNLLVNKTSLTNAYQLINGDFRVCQNVSNRITERAT